MSPRRCIYCGQLRPRTPVGESWAHRVCIERERLRPTGPATGAPPAPEPPPQEEEPGRKPHLSATAISMLAKCGEQYRRRYIEGEKVPPAVAMLIGRGVDASVNQNMETKIETGQLLPEEAVKDRARDALRKEWESGEVMLTQEERELGARLVRDTAIDETVSLAALHVQKIAPEISPEFVQRWWRVDLQNFPYDLVGVMDIEETTNVVRDTKTSGKSPSKDEADRSLQLSLYALKRKVIDGAFPEKLTLDYLVRTKTPKAVVVETERDDQDIRTLLLRVEAAAGVIESERFLPANETDWWCSERWCGYWSTCKYVRGHRRPTS